jgi:hypothetical protein
VTGTVQQLRRLASAIRGIQDPRDVANTALAAFGVIAAAVTLVSVVESYSNLAGFAWTHQMTAWHGAIAPVAVDAQIAMGELLLFIALLKHWRGWGVYALAGGLVLGGFAMSVGGNVWHASAATPIDRAVQAIWPVTATAALAAALVVIKRLMNDHAQPGQQAVTAPVPVVQAPLPVPPPAREPRRDEEPENSPGGEARAPGLVAAPPARSAESAQLAQLSADEHAVALALMDVSPLPGEQKLHTQYPGISRRRCRAVLDTVRASRNGGSHGGHN